MVLIANDEQSSRIGLPNSDQDLRNYLDKNVRIYNPDWYPNLIASSIKELCVNHQVPAALLGSSFLGALSACFQTVANVQVLGQRVVPISLITCVVADSGSRKTSVDEKINAFFLRLESLKTQLLPEVERNRLIMEIDADRIKLLKGKAKKERDEAARQKLIEEILEIQSKPKFKVDLGSYISTDVTPGSLLQKLEKIESDFIHNNDAGSIFSGRALSELSVFNQLWDGAGAGRGRMDKKHIQVPRHARVTMSLMVQSEIFNHFLKTKGLLARSSGFFARVLFSAPEDLRGKRDHNVGTDLYPFTDSFNDRMYGHMLAIAEDRINPVDRRTLIFSDCGSRHLKYFNIWLEELQADGKGAELVRDAASKAAENAARIAALFHLFEDGWRGKDVISERHTLSAILLSAWHLIQFRSLTLSITPEQKNEILLEKFLRDKQGQEGVFGHSRTYLLQCSPVAIRNKNALNLAIKGLINSGKAHYNSDGGLFYGPKPAMSYSF